MVLLGHFWHSLKNKKCDNRIDGLEGEMLNAAEALFPVLLPALWHPVIKRLLTFAYLASVLHDRYTTLFAFDKSKLWSILLIRYSLLMPI